MDITKWFTLANSANGVVLLIFLLLKLTGSVSWSWWFILCPVWIPLVYLIGVIIFVEVYNGR